jgi:hypothetical protein
MQDLAEIATIHLHEVRGGQAIDCPPVAPLGPGPHGNAELAEHESQLAALDACQGRQMDALNLSIADTLRRRQAIKRIREAGDSP